MGNVNLITPSDTVIREYCLKFLSSNAEISDIAIRKLINVFPLNTNLEEILLKSIAINTLYSTNIFKISEMAKRILKLNIDERINNGDPNIVNLIASGHGIISNKTNKELNFYSFATKYCNWHNHEEYSIYDSYVEKILLEYKKLYSFTEFKANDLKDFSKFKSVLLDFKTYFNLTGTMKEIDKFLWLYGKEKFPKSYN